MAAPPPPPLAKNYFILTSAGKPVFYWHGTDEEMSSTMGVVQAIVSVCEDAGHVLRALKAGKERIVFLLRGALYFFAVSSTGEPEAALVKQLQFLYHQTLFVLTSKVHAVLDKTPGYDLRDLLGDTRSFEHSLRDVDTTSCAWLMRAVHAVRIDPTLRGEVGEILRATATQANCLVAVLFQGKRLVACAQPRAKEHRIGEADMLLLSNLVMSNASLRHSEHMWIPICLPEFNDKGFLQAYVSFLDHDMDLCLLLICTQNDPQQFHLLQQARNVIFDTFQKQEVLRRMRDNLTEHHQRHLSKTALQLTAMHFVFKFTPRGSGGAGVPSSIADGTSSVVSGGVGGGGGGRGGGGGGGGGGGEGTGVGGAAAGGVGGILAQIIAPNFGAPLTHPASQVRIFKHYQRLALRLRAGGSCADTLLLPPPRSMGGRRSRSTSSRAARRKQHAALWSPSGAATRALSMRRGNSGLAASATTTAAANAGSNAGGGFASTMLRSRSRSPKNGEGAGSHAPSASSSPHGAGSEEEEDDDDDSEDDSDEDVHDDDDDDEENGDAVIGGGVGSPTPHIPEGAVANAGAGGHYGAEPPPPPAAESPFTELPTHGGWEPAGVGDSNDPFAWLPGQYSSSYCVAGTETFVGIATREWELYVTFPFTTPPAQAWGLASYLHRQLNQEVDWLFQTMRLEL